MMTGGAITARQALDWGLLWRLLPEATLVDEVIRLAERLARVFPYCHKQLDDPSVGIRPREESVSRRARPSGPSSRPMLSFYWPFTLTVPLDS